VQAPGFLGNIGIYELHELGELTGAGGRQDQVGMRGQEDKGMDRHVVEGLRLADDAEDEVSQLGRGFEKQPALQRAGGYLDEGLLGDETEWSRHACLSACVLAELLRPISGQPLLEECLLEECPAGRRLSGRKPLAPDWKKASGTGQRTGQRGTSAPLARRDQREDSFWHHSRAYSRSCFVRYPDSR